MNDDSDWPDGMRELVDKELVVVVYDETGAAEFYLTDLGRAAKNAIDKKLN